MSDATPVFDIEIIAEDERIPVRLGKAIFWVRRMPDGKELEIRLAHVVGAKANAKAVAQANAAIAEAKFDYILLDWEGVGDPTTGRAAPCDARTKRMLPLALKQALIARAMMPNTQGDEAGAEEEGNSAPSPASGPAPALN